MKESPLRHYPEHQCYAFARNMMGSIAKRPNKAATARFVASHVSKPISLQEYEIRAIAQYYWRTFMVVPYGETVRIALR